MSILPENLDKARTEVRRLEKLRDQRKKALEHAPTVYFYGDAADLGETILDDIRILALEGLRVKIAASIALLAWYGVNVDREEAPETDCEALAAISETYSGYLADVERQERERAALAINGHPAAAALDARA